MVTDPIADMIIQLKNAQMAGLPSVLVPYSVFKQNIAEVLKTAGFIKTVINHAYQHRLDFVCSFFRNRNTHDLGFGYNLFSFI